MMTIKTADCAVPLFELWGSNSVIFENKEYLERTNNCQVLRFEDLTIVRL